MDRSPCSGCGAADCPAAEGTAGAGQAGSPPAGWRLGLASLGLFVGPVVLAIVGAAGFGDGPGGQFVGAIAGLGLGVAGAVSIARMVSMARMTSRPPEKTA